MVKPRNGFLFIVSTLCAFTTAARAQECETNSRESESILVFRENGPEIDYIERFCDPENLKQAKLVVPKRFLAPAPGRARTRGRLAITIPGDFDFERELVSLDALVEIVRGDNFRKSVPIRQFEHFHSSTGHAPSIDALATWHENGFDSHQNEVEQRNWLWRLFPTPHEFNPRIDCNIRKRLMLSSNDGCMLSDIGIPRKVQELIGAKDCGSSCVGPNLVPGLPKKDEVVVFVELIDYEIHDGGACVSVQIPESLCGPGLAIRVDALSGHLNGSDVEPSSREIFRIPE